MVTQQYKAKSNLDRYSVSTCRAPLAMAEQIAVNTLADPIHNGGELCDLRMYPIRKGCWADAEWLVVATFRKLPN